MISMGPSGTQCSHDLALGLTPLSRTALDNGGWTIRGRGGCALSVILAALSAFPARDQQESMPQCVDVPRSNTGGTPLPAIFPRSLMTATWISRQS